MAAAQPMQSGGQAPEYQQQQWAATHVPRRTRELDVMQMLERHQMRLHERQAPAPWEGEAPTQSTAKKAAWQSCPCAHNMPCKPIAS